MWSRRTKQKKTRNNEAEAESKGRKRVKGRKGEIDKNKID